MFRRFGYSQYCMETLTSDLRVKLYEQLAPIHLHYIVDLFTWVALKSTPEVKQSEVDVFIMNCNEIESDRLKFVTFSSCSVDIQLIFK